MNNITSGQQMLASSKQHMMGSGQLHQNQLSGGVQKQRLKSATMGKRIQRGISRDNVHQDDQNYDEDRSQRQFDGYQGHLSHTGMPQVDGRAQQYTGGQR